MVAAVFVSAVALSLSGPQASPADTTRLRPLFDAIRFVESGNRPNPPDGDGGRSIGPYQIMEAYHRDAYGACGGLGGWQRCRERAYAERIMIRYWQRYCPEALAAGDWETLARVHNGGPRGHRKTATRAYWLKVRKALKGAAR